MVGRAHPTVLRDGLPLERKVNPKHEIRNTKSTRGSLGGQIQNANVQMTETTSLVAGQNG